MLNGGLCVMATDALFCVSCQARRGTTGSDTEQFLACQDKTCIALKHTTEQDENVFLVSLETAPSSPHFYYLSNIWVLYPSETPHQFTGLSSSHFYQSSLHPMTSMSWNILENKPLNPEWQIIPKQSLQLPCLYKCENWIKWGSEISRSYMHEPPQILDE